MNEMDWRDRYQPLHKSRCQYASSRQNGQLNNGNPLQSSNGQPKRMDYAYFPATTSVASVMTNKTIPSSSAIPQERESWIRSVKRTKINGNTEQKTQYFETMRHIPQSSTNAANFDRIRFADQQIPTTTNATENNLGRNSFHLIGDISNNDDICVIESVLFNNEVQSKMKPTSEKMINGESTTSTDADSSRWSGFLIDNFDADRSSPISPPPCPTSSLPAPPLPVISSIEEFVQQHQKDRNRQGAMLVYEFDTADAEQRHQSKRQKQSHKKLQKKNTSKTTQPAKPATINPKPISTGKKKKNKNTRQELPSDWIVEYNNTQTGQMPQPIKETSTAITVEEKVANINAVVRNIRKKQQELTRLRERVLSMLSAEPKSNSSNEHDLLMNILNQSITSECWLCSGKSYTEVAIQCNNIHE